MKNHNLLLSLFLSVLLFLGCGGDDKDKCPGSIGNTGEIIEEYVFSSVMQNDTADCAIPFPESSFVIRTQDEYDALIQSLYWAFSDNLIECDSIDLPIIDFANHSLIGRKTGGYGCSIYFDKDVTFYEDERTAIYTINIINCGTCPESKNDMFIVKVPAIPDTWHVSYSLRNSLYQAE